MSPWTTPTNPALSTETFYVYPHWATNGTANNVILATNTNWNTNYWSIDPRPAPRAYANLKALARAMLARVGNRHPALRTLPAAHAPVALVSATRPAGVNRPHARTMRRRFRDLRR